MRKTCSLLIALAMSAAASVAMATTSAPKWSLIPEPAIARPAAHGEVTVKSGDHVVVEAHGNMKAFIITHMFTRLVRKTRGLSMDMTAGRGTRARDRIIFDLDPAAHFKSKAGYRIDIGQGRIHLTASTLRGLYYGSVTTWQLLTSNPVGHGQAHVADGIIIDHPRFKWRGMMLDSSRHFQSVADIRKLIDWMSLHKLDVLHWHLTDDQGWRLQIPQYPKLTSVGGCRKAVGQDAVITGSPDKPYCGYYTDKQVKALVKYAAKHFVTIVPEIEMPGHAQAAIAAYPSLGVTGKRPHVSTDYGISKWLYAPDQHTIAFLENVLDEVMKLFPSQYIHIGGDEAIKAQWKASPKVRAHMQRLGLKNMDQMQGWMMDKIGAWLAAHGRTMVGWDEILNDGHLPPNAVVMSWHGVSGAIKAAKEGHDAVLSPSPVLYLDHVQSNAHDEPAARPLVESLKDVYTFNPSPASLTPAQARHILGVQGNLWTEYMPSFARDMHAVFPKMAAWSEVAWSPASAINWDSFLARMPAQIARDHKLDIAYADSAWAPRFALTDSAGKIDVTLSNQVHRGSIRYTTNGSPPTAHAARYTQPLTLPAGRTTTLKAATFAADGLQLAATRTRHIDAESLLTRNSDQLTLCKTPHGIPLRLQDDRPLNGYRPVYKVDISDTCWLWKNAPLNGVNKISIRVGNLPWRFSIPYIYNDVTTRPEVTPDGEIDVRLDSCTGPRIARLPLAPAAKTKQTTVLSAKLPAMHGKHTLCIFATGDPRKGTIWAIDTVKLSPASQFLP